MAKFLLHQATKDFLGKSFVILTLVVKTMVSNESTAPTPDIKATLDSSLFIGFQVLHQISGTCIPVSSVCIPIY